MDKNEVLKFLRLNKELFAQKYQISKLALFGSFARGDNAENSDVDILFALKDGRSMSFDAYMEFESELESAFGAKIDLVNEKKLNPLVELTAKKDFIYV